MREMGSRAVKVLWRKRRFVVSGHMGFCLNRNPLDDITGDFFSELGRPAFRDLLFRRRQCVFIAFDLLYLNGKDLRPSALIERKAALKKLLRRKRSRILYLDHMTVTATS